jgi:hypothetical protein
MFEVDVGRVQMRPDRSVEGPGFCKPRLLASKVR